MTWPQVEAFANLLGEPVDVVAGRLRNDASLIPSAAAAATARLGRQSSGKTMMATGFMLFGFGLTLSFGAFLTTAHGWCDDPRQCQNSPMNAEAKTIDVVGLVTAAIGLALAVPGIVRTARPSDIEAEAVDRYQRSQSGQPSASPPGDAHSLSGGSGGKALSLSLWSFAF